MDEFEDKAKYVDWVFEPFTPVRPDMPEAMFVRRWQKLMGGSRKKVDVFFIENESYDYPILKAFQYGYPSTRDTQVATSVIAFLGTGLGRTFLENAEKLTKIFEAELPFKEETAYLAAWALENDPYSPRQSYPIGTYSYRDSLMGNEKLTMRDSYAMDCVMRWLGTKEGQKFLTGCKAELQRGYAKQRVTENARLFPEVLKTPTPTS